MISGVLENRGRAEFSSNGDFLPSFSTASVPRGGRRGGGLGGMEIFWIFLSMISVKMTFLVVCSCGAGLLILAGSK